MRKYLFFIAFSTLFVLGCENSDGIGVNGESNSNNNEANNEQIAEIKSQITNIQSTLINLLNTDNELRQYINNVLSQKEMLEQADSKLADEIAKLKTELSDTVNVTESNILAQLEELRSYVQSQLISLSASIDTLQAKDIELNARIDSLNAYVDSELKDNKDWVTASFATLDQYNATAGIVATIQQQIVDINTRFDTIKIASSGISTDEFNTSITQLNVNFNTLLSELNIELNSSMVDMNDSLKAEIKQVANDAAASVNAAKTEITTAYTSAISSAIISSEESLKSWINSRLSSYYTMTQIDTKLNNLRTDINSQLDAQKTYLIGLINNLEIALNNKIIENRKMIDTLKIRANGFDSDISSIVINIATNAGLIEANALNISANSARINTCSANIDSCNVYIAANKMLIKDNETAIEANSSAISALRTRMSSAEVNITANGNAINGNATDILNNATAIAKNAQDIAANAVLISSNATAISNNAQAISDNVAAITQLRTDLATARTEITAAYKKAISDAIIDLDGKLSGRIATVVDSINTQVDDKVSTINQTIAALTTRVEKCEQEIVTIKGNITRMQQAIDYLEEKVAAILSRIQSVTYVPEYSDGKATMTFKNNNGTITPGIATLSYRFLPAITATELAAVWENAISMEAIYTLTRAGENYIPLQIISAVASNGYLNITVSGANIENTFFKGERKVSVTMVISDGNNQISTDYVELMPRMPETAYIPDEAFRTYLVGQFDTDDDGELSYSEIDAITEINVASKGIQNLSGIEWMHNLVTLNAAGNGIKNIDLHYCPKLTSLIINDNQLNSIDLTENTALTTLDVSGNNIQLLDVSKAKNLNSLICSDNQIATLNVSSNPALTVLQCGNNAIEALNVTSNKQLTTFDCNNNALTELNLSYNTALQYLNCSANYLASLNITYLTKLLSLDCSGNKITELDLNENLLLRTLDCRSNKLVKLDVSMCTSMTLLRCSDNTTLGCLMMEDEAQQTKIVLTKDNETLLRLYSQFIPFEDTKLSSIILTNYDFDDNGIISSDEADAIIEVNCKNKGITSLKGLERCHNLRVLDCSSNNIQEIILPNMENLNSIACYDNPLSLLDIHGSNITHLYLVAAATECRNGNLLTLSSYTASSALELNLNGTGITTMNVTGTNLNIFSFIQSTDVNNITVTNNTALSKILFAPSCTKMQINGNTKLKSIDITALSILDSLDVYNNALTTLDISSNTMLKRLDCGKNALTNLNTNNNTNLKYLRMDDNNLKAINVRNNTMLETLIINNNPQISMLNLMENSALIYLEACSLAVSRIDISANEALEYVKITNNANIAVLKVKDRDFYASAERSIYFYTGNGNCEVHDIYDNVLVTFDSNVIPLFTNTGVWAAKCDKGWNYTNYPNSYGEEYAVFTMSDALFAFTDTSSHYLDVLLNTLPGYTCNLLYLDRWTSGGYSYMHAFDGSESGGQYTGFNLIRYTFKRLL